MVYDVVIAGGGIMGMLTAFRLSESGQRVALLDRQSPGCEASWAGGGLLFSLSPWSEPLVVQRLIAESTGFYRLLADDLQASTGIDVGYRQQGALFMDIDTTRCREWLATQPIESIDYADDVVYFPFFAQVRNSRLMRALRIVLSAHPSCDVYIDEPLFDWRAIRIDSHQDHLLHFITPHHQIRGKQFLLCMGAWTTQFIHRQWQNTSYRRHDRLPDVTPVKGQMIAIQAPLGLLPYPIVTASGYLIPRTDGLILIGSTVENCGYDKSLDYRTAEQLYEWACRWVPPLKNFPVAYHWAGLRPAATQPYIGKVPGYDNLFAAAGHFRSGLTTAPVTSTMLMAELMGGASDPHINHLLFECAWSLYDHGREQHTNYRRPIEECSG